MSAASDPQASVRRAGKSAAAFRTISEVATELDLPQHVLRFWESKFPQIRPMKRGGGRRYYRPEDMDLLRRIRSLLYDDGYTIKGVQKILRDQHGRGGAVIEEAGVEDAAIEDGPEEGIVPAMAVSKPDERGLDRQSLRDILAELEAIRRML
jgi:DNA-binding transcriptional MerR regulator